MQINLISLKKMKYLENIYVFMVREHTEVAIHFTIWGRLSFIGAWLIGENINTNYEFQFLNIVDLSRN